MKRLLLPLLAALALPTAVNANVLTGEIVYKTEIGEKFLIKRSAVKIVGYEKSSLIDLYKGDKDEVENDIFLRSKKVKANERDIKELDENYVKNEGEKYEKEIEQLTRKINLIKEKGDFKSNNSYVEGCKNFSRKKQRLYCEETYSTFYFASLKLKEKLRELNNYKSKVLDQLIKKKSFLELENKGLNGEISRLNLNLSRINQSIKTLEEEKENLLFESLVFRPIFTDLNSKKTALPKIEAVCKNYSASPESIKLLDKKFNTTQANLNNPLEKRLFATEYTSLDYAPILELKLLACNKLSSISK